MANKIDSNVTGLRFAEEATLGVLSGSPIFFPLEPNSYPNFGGQTTTTARKPINPTRQQKKGVLTDLSASGAFVQDLTFSNLTRLFQGFFFADIREKFTTAPMNSAAVVLTGVTGSSKTIAAGAGLSGFLASHLVLAAGFTNSTNNGLKSMASASTATTAVVNETMADEVPTSAASLSVVGYQFASATLDVVVANGVATLTRASGAFDFTTLGLVAGEPIYVGGDTVGTTFANNVGFARVSAVTASSIELDKTTWTAQAETGTGKTIRIFFGSVLKNESTSNLIKRRSVQLERTLGSDTDGVMSEYIKGAVPNEMTINIPQAEKVTVEMSFVGIDHEQRTGATGVKTATRPALVAQSAFNTSSDIKLIKLAKVDVTTPAPSPLFAYATEVSISVKNNVSADKAVGVLGAFDTSAGMFEVGGKMTAYFADIAAVKAVRDNADVTLSVILQKKNLALSFDIPLLALGGGELAVEPDKAITLPLDVKAAESKFGHTLLFASFPYLPDAAGGV